MPLPWFLFIVIFSVLLTTPGLLLSLASTVKCKVAGSKPSTVESSVPYNTWSLSSSGRVIFVMKLFVFVMDWLDFVMQLPDNEMENCGLDYVAFVKHEFDFEMEYLLPSFLQ